MSSFSQRPLRLAQIGVGGFGKTHLSMTAPFRSSGAIQMVAAADPSPALAQEKADFEAQGIAWYADYRELLARHGASLDLINIAAPIPLHEEMVAEALRSSPARIYLEKAAVPTLEQLDRLIALDADSRVNVGFHLLCSPAVRQTRRWVNEGRLGRILNAGVVACWPRGDVYYERASWSGRMFWKGLPCFDGPATNACSHFLQNIMYVLGRGRDCAVPEIVTGEFYRARTGISYDTCSLGGTFAEGATYTVNFIHACREQYGVYLHLVGEKGWVRIDQGSQIPHNSLGLGVDADLVRSGTPVADSYACFMEWVQGKADAPPCSLENTRGYAVATEGGLASSEGIRDIPGELLERYDFRDSKAYAIKGLDPLLVAEDTQFLPFSRLAPAWGRPGRPIASRTLPSDILRQYSGELAGQTV